MFSGHSQVLQRSGIEHDYDNSKPAHGDISSHTAQTYENKSSLIRETFYSLLSNPLHISLCQCRNMEDYYQIAMPTTVSLEIESHFFWYLIKFLLFPAGPFGLLNHSHFLPSAATLRSSWVILNTAQDRAVVLLSLPLPLCLHIPIGIRTKRSKSTSWSKFSYEISFVRTLKRDSFSYDSAVSLVSGAAFTFRFVQCVFPHYLFLFCLFLFFFNSLTISYVT